MKITPVGVFGSLASVLSLASLAGLDPGRADSDLLVDFRGPEILRLHLALEDFLAKMLDCTTGPVLQLKVF